MTMPGEFVSTAQTWAEKRPAEGAESATGLATRHVDDTQGCRPSTAPLAPLPKLGQRPQSARPLSDHDRLQQLYGKTANTSSSRRLTTAATLGRQFGATEGVLKPTARLAHTQAQTLHKDRECLAEEWQQLLCQIDPSHPDYVQLPLGENLDPYTLAYTSLLLKEAAAGALPMQDQNGEYIQLQGGGGRRLTSSARRDLHPADVTQFIVLLDDLLDGAISRIRENGEMKPSGRGRYDFVNMSSEDRLGVLKRVYGKGMGPRKATLSYETRLRLHDHLRLGKHMGEYYDEMPQEKREFIAEALDKERQGQQASVREAVAAALQKERGAAERRMHEAVSKAQAEQQALHDAVLAQLQAVHGAAIAQLRAEHDQVLLRERAETQSHVQALQEALTKATGGDHEAARETAVEVTPKMEIPAAIEQPDPRILGGLAPDSVAAWVTRVRAANAKLRAQLLSPDNADSNSVASVVADLAALQATLDDVQVQMAGKLTYQKASAAGGRGADEGTEVVGDGPQEGDGKAIDNAEAYSPTWLQEQLFDLAREMKELLESWAKAQAKLAISGDGQMQVLVLDLMSGAAFEPAKDDGPPPLPPISSLLELLNHAGRDTTDACSTACATYLTNPITKARHKALQYPVPVASTGLPQGKGPMPPDPSAVWPGTPYGTEDGRSRPRGRRQTSDSGRLSRVSDNGKRIFYDEVPMEPGNDGKLRPSLNGSTTLRSEESPLATGMTSPISPLGAHQATLPGEATTVNSSAQIEGNVVDQASSARMGRASSATRQPSRGGIRPPSAQASSGSPANMPDTPGRLTPQRSSRVASDPQPPLSAAVQASLQAIAGQPLPSSADVQGGLADAILQVRRLLDTSNALMSVAEQMLKAQQADVIALLGANEVSRAHTSSSSAHFVMTPADLDTADQGSTDKMASAPESAVVSQTPAAEAEGKVMAEEAATAAAVLAATFSNRVGVDATEGMQSAPVHPDSSLSPSRTVVGVLLAQIRSMQSAVAEHLGAMLFILDDLSKEETDTTKEEPSHPASDPRVTVDATTSGAKLVALLHHLHQVSKELIGAVQQLVELQDDVLGSVGLLEAGQLLGMQAMAAHLDELMGAFNALYSSGLATTAGGQPGQQQTDAVVLWSVQPVLQLWTRGIHAAWSQARQAAARDLKKAEDLAAAQSALVLGHIATLEETAALAAAAAEAAAASATATADAAARRTPTVDKKKEMEAVILKSTCDSLQQRLDALTSEHEALQAELEDVKDSLKEAQAEAGKVAELKTRLTELEACLAELEKKLEEKQTEKPRMVDRGVSPDQPPVVEKGCCGC